MSEHQTFNICVEPIELSNLLKIAKMVEDNSEAKTMISEGHVLVNNKVVFQKRKKLRRGDIVEHNGKVIEIAFDPTDKSAEFIEKVVLATKKSQLKKRARSKARAALSKTVTTPTEKKLKAKP